MNIAIGFLCQGGYQLLAASHAPGYAADDVVAYELTTAAGDCLRRERKLSVAREWLDRLLDEAALAAAPSPCAPFRVRPLRR